MIDIEFKNLVGKSAFGVCSYISEKFGVSITRVRLYFIYLSCATLGSSFVAYLFLAFWVNIRKYLKRNNRAVWE
ncbi:MAG: PspC domain-containing protein [Cyclobacteriaceae bacterium]|jgi:phage shock protein C|nr:PspC domain-containing protein [Saprospiraceae bacterium]MCA0334933.1 PspC domain-containing protein [Bacteroidota bacterium]TXI71001.1 MAG: PspC domain-containing protein [Cyclobacteriaceae bacterium]MCB0603762.1 PspC domain-containing protein [Saprospiraceae bacterium]MCO5279081.1 PspC domain-containing protein [Saprospiraceae bacterium]